MLSLIEINLLKALQSGDEAAFAALVNNHQQMVFNTALSMVQSVEDAEDVAQEVFIQVYETIRSFRGDAKISTWLYRITITKSLDRIKFKKRKKRFAFVTNLFGGVNEGQAEGADFFHPGVQMENKERSAVLFKAVNALPDNQRIAFTLHKAEGLSYQEIAEVMDATAAAVEGYMHRAKQNLRKLLMDYYQK